MIKAIIFDADGMVVKGEKFSQKFSKDFNIPIEKISEFFEKEFPACRIGKNDLSVAIEPYLKEWEFSGTVKDVFNFWFEKCYYVDQDVLKFIEQFKAESKICILATNQEKHRLSFFKKEMGLEKVFDHIICSCEVGYTKKEPEFLNKICQLIPEIKKEEILFFDDTESNIEAVKNFGFQAKLYKNLEDLNI